VLALSAPPPESRTRRPLPSTSRVTASCTLGAEAAGLVGRPACEVRAAEAGREAEVVLDQAGGAGLTAGRLTLDHHGGQPLRRAVDRGGETGGTTTDDDQVIVVGHRLVGDPEPLGELEHRRALQHRAVLHERDRQALVADTRDAQQLARLAVALDVQPAAGNAVAGQEVTELVRGLGEAVADDAHAAGLQRRAGLPGRQEVLDDGVELLLRWVPRLEQVVVERDLVDRLDRGAGVGVGGEQDALGVRGELARLDEVLGPREAGHALIGDQQRNLVAARDQLADDLQRLLPRGCAQDAEALAELAAQVTGHRGEDRGFVVDGDDGRSTGAFRSVGRHLPPSFSCPSRPEGGTDWHRRVGRAGGADYAPAGAVASRRATSARTTGATSVPNSSIERSTSAWATDPMLI
jgi:hypothetical protein